MPAAIERNVSAARPAEAGFLLRRTPRDARTRRMAELVWSSYPPVAMLVVTLLLAAGGCQLRGDQPARAAAPAAQLANDTIMTEAGDAATPGAPAEAQTTVAQGPIAYPSELPLVGTAAGRAVVRHGKNRIELANLSKLPWSNGRLWLNRQYSAPLPALAPGSIASFDFAWFRDETGQAFPTDNDQILVDQVELVLGDERTRIRYSIGY